MNRSIARRALMLGYCLLATVTASAQTMSPYREPLNYQSPLLVNKTVYSSTTGTAGANDCSQVNGQPRTTFGPNHLQVLYVSPNGTDSTAKGAGGLSNPLKTGAGANAIVKPGQLVCFETGTYWPFTINTSGSATSETDMSHIVRFEVVPGDIAKIDLLNCPTTTEPCWQYNGEIYEGINIAPPTPSGSIKYVLVSGFYVQGPNETLAQSATSYADAKNNLNDQGVPSAYYNATCIGVNGNQGGKDYVAGGEADHIYIVANTVAGCGGAGIGAGFADYVTIDGNIVYDCNWYNIYGESAVGIGQSLDTNPNDPLYPNSYPHTYKNYIINNTIFNNIQFEPAGPNAGYSAPGSINDGEGIIIDTNLNTAVTGCTTGQAYCSVQPYSGWTLISNNQVWANGSSGIQSTLSQNIDITFNTTFNNGTNYPNEPNRAEITDYDSLNITVASNLLYGSGFDTTFAQIFDGGPEGNTAFGNYQYNGIVHLTDNTGYSCQNTDIVVPAAYPPIQSNQTGENFQFAGIDTYACGGAPSGSPYYGEYATNTDTVYNAGGLAIAATSDPDIQNSTNYFALPYDILGNARPSGNNTVAAGAFTVAF